MSTMKRMTALALCLIMVLAFLPNSAMAAVAVTTSHVSANHAHISVGTSSGFANAITIGTAAQNSSYSLGGYFTYNQEIATPTNLEVKFELKKGTQTVVAEANATDVEADTSNVTFRMSLPRVLDVSGVVYDTILVKLYEAGSNIKTHTTSVITASAASTQKLGYTMGSISGYASWSRTSTSGNSDQSISVTYSDYSYYQRMSSEKITMVLDTPKYLATDGSPSGTFAGTIDSVYASSTGVTASLDSSKRITVSYYPTSVTSSFYITINYTEGGTSKTATINFNLSNTGSAYTGLYLNLDKPAAITVGEVATLRGVITSAYGSTGTSYATSSSYYARYNNSSLFYPYDPSTSRIFYNGVWQSYSTSYVTYNDVISYYGGVSAIANTGYTGTTGTTGVYNPTGYFAQYGSSSLWYPYNISNGTIYYNGSWQGYSSASYRTYDWLISSGYSASLYGYTGATGSGTYANIPITFTTTAATSDVTLSNYSTQSVLFKASKAGTYYVTATVPEGYTLLNANYLSSAGSSTYLGNQPSQYCVPLGGIYYYYNVDTRQYLSEYGWILFSGNSAAYQPVSAVGVSRVFLPASYGYNYGYSYNYGTTNTGARSRTFEIVVTDKAGAAPTTPSTGDDIIIDDGASTSGAAFKSGTKMGRLLKSTVSGYDEAYKTKTNFSGPWVAVLATKNANGFVKISTGTKTGFVPAALIDVGSSALPADGELKTVTVKTYASLRAKASDSGKRLEKVYDGTEVIALNETSGKYTECWYNGQIGWILTSYLK